MSVSPEGKKRFLADAVKKLTIQPKPESDSERFINRYFGAVGTVRKQLAPIADSETMSGRIHTAEGRTMFLKTSQSLFLDEFVRQGYNRDELLFLLSILNAQLTLNEIA